MSPCQETGVMTGVIADALKEWVALQNNSSAPVIGQFCASASQIPVRLNWEPQSLVWLLIWEPRLYGFSFFCP